MTPATNAAITFSELLHANELETKKWREWFERQPAEVLDLPLTIAGTKNVREFLQHIFAVELRYAERLNGEPITPYESLPTGNVEELFGIGDMARALLRSYLSNATEEDLAEVQASPTRSAGTLRASKRKMFAHTMLHGIRHWAQLATALRQAGHPADWTKDFLFSEAIE